MCRGLAASVRKSFATLGNCNLQIPAENIIATVNKQLSLVMFELPGCFRPEYLFKEERMR